MRNLFWICLLVCFAACSEGKRPLAGETEYQKKLNSLYKDASTSPLKKKDLKDFRGLDFYPVDSAFVVTAKLERTPDAPIFKFPRTLGDKVDYLQYGILTFNIKGKELQVPLYRSIDDLRSIKNRDQLFLPFTDETSGDGSYGGGRYLNLFESKIRPDNTLVLDFNNTYNPYCAYNENYSCPIVPRKNYLDVAITAGVKDFKKAE